MFEVHKHPLDPSKKIVGRHVEPGETLRGSDVRPVQTGVWEEISYKLIGTVVGQDQCNMFVRPV